MPTTSIAPPPPEKSPDSRFSRHELIPGWRQSRLAEANVIIIGIGALGNEVARILAMSGITRFILCDPDRVSLSNLSRCALFREQDLGRLKVEAAQDALAQLAPAATVSARPLPLAQGVGLAELRDASLVFSCLDSRTARIQLAGRCGLVQAPWIDGGTSPWGGEARPYLNPEGPCYACALLETQRIVADIPISCANPGADETPVGASAAVSALVGGWMALLGIRHLMGLPVTDEILRIDGDQARQQRVRQQRDPACLLHVLIGPTRRLPVSCQDRLSSLQESVGEENQILLSQKPTPRQAQTGLLAKLPEREAVRLAYAEEIENVASLLQLGLSVLISCDKLVVEPLWQEIIAASKLKAKTLQVSDINTVQSTLLQGQLSLLRQSVEFFEQGEVLVVPHLDLVAGGTGAYPSDAAREFTELAYRASERCILAFTDVSMEIPEVLASRFAIRKQIAGVPRMVTLPSGEEVLFGQAFVTASEAKRIKDFDPEGLYKSISGMNPVQIRHAIAYALHSSQDKLMPMDDLHQAIRVFKAKTSANFELPDVKFSDIGGYANVKEQLTVAIDLLEGAYQVPDERLRREFIPRGFIFHGKPGTGKTLFAKAVANRLKATVMVVSGPETLDKWLGESERKVREIFAEARRNAPSVLIFDEFDAIASKRTNILESSGNRALNSMVAQILTEMDGFRPDVPMLVIGTTNRIDIIDEAFLRPSRFHAIAIDLPDKIARRDIARIHARHFGIAVTGELLDAIAETTSGFSGDEIHAIFRDACIGMYKTPPVAADGFCLGQLIDTVRRNKAEQKGGSMMTRLG